MYNIMVTKGIGYKANKGRRYSLFIKIMSAICIQIMIYHTFYAKKLVFLSHRGCIYCSSWCFSPPWQRFKSFLHDRSEDLNQKFEQN